MPVDLYKTKEELLIDWCKSKGFFSSVDVTAYGLKNFYTSAPRRIRELCEEGKIKRLSGDEIIFRGLWHKGQQHVAWYRFVGEQRQLVIPI